MVGCGRDTGIEAAESGCLSRGSFRDSENIAAADRGLPSLGFRMYGHRKPNQLECAPPSEFSQPRSVSRQAT
jgi:hypothetical protein